MGASSLGTLEAEGYPLVFCAIIVEKRSPLPSGVGVLFFTGWSVVARGGARAGGGVLHYFSRQQVAKKNVRAPTVCLRARPLRHSLHSRSGSLLRIKGGIWAVAAIIGSYSPNRPSYPR